MRVVQAFTLLVTSSELWLIIGMVTLMRFSHGLVSTFRCLHQLFFNHLLTQSDLFVLDIKFLYSAGYYAAAESMLYVLQNGGSNHVKAGRWRSMSGVSRRDRTHVQHALR